MVQIALTDCATFDPVAAVHAIVADPEMYPRVLSKVCRWAGHTTHFYSVLQHAVNVGSVACLLYRQLVANPSYQETVAVKRMGYFHEIDEIVYGDVISPVKRKAYETGCTWLRETSLAIHTAWVDTQPMAAFYRSSPIALKCMVAADLLLLHLEALAIIDYVPPWVSASRFEELCTLNGVSSNQVVDHVDLSERSPKEAIELYKYVLRHAS